MDAIWPVVVLLAVILPGFYILAHVCNWAGANCPYCRRKLTPFRRLPDEQQQRILAYYGEREKREPDLGEVYLCRACGVIRDDFTEAHRPNLPMNHPLAGQALSYITHCKICHAPLLNCAPDDERIECPECGAAFTWAPYGDSECRFLQPPEGSEVVEP